MTIYLVMAEWGEYEQFTEEIRGVFSTFEKAKSAVFEMEKISDETRAENKASDKKWEDRPAFWVHEGVIYRIFEAKMDLNHPKYEPFEVWSSDVKA